MSGKTLENLYAQLTPAELFRLIMAANARGDEAERNRLAHAGKRISMSMAAHSPYARAFEELNFVTYIDLLDQAAEYLDAHARAGNAIRVGDVKVPARTTTNEVESAIEDSEGAADKQHQWVRSYEVVYGTGFFFKLNMAGWKLFSARWHADGPGTEG